MHSDSTELVRNRNRSQIRREVELLSQGCPIMVFNGQDVSNALKLPGVDQEAGWADKIQEIACSAGIAAHFLEQHLRVVKVAAGIMVGAVHPVWWVFYQKWTEQQTRSNQKGAGQIPLYSLYLVAWWQRTHFPDIPMQEMLGGTGTNADNMQNSHLELGKKQPGLQTAVTHVDTINSSLCCIPGSS